MWIMSVVIETTIGDITVDLYLKERPNTCLNFLKLCKIKYYNLCLFHKIERNFIAQTGDPTGTGRGGESVFSQLYGNQAKYFDAEFKPRLKHEKLGTISMVNNGNNMNGSQFFLTVGENLTYLDEVHTVFGEVAEGFEVLLKLNEAICDNNNRPYQDIRITHTVILHDPYDDPSGLEIPDVSPEPTREQLESNYIAADEEIDDTKGKDPREIEERIKESEAKARATILEMVGDIPDADVKPPENVLFVCKLNPVTTSEDLEVIFSRFGQIVSCEVIKDKKTGESLQYAFIEFEKEEDCENAYFKMDNVLIDDRRIHVDFSQSVSKMNWDKNDKLINTGQKSKSQNIILKSNSRPSDGYDLIFDNSDDHAEAKNSKTKHYQQTETSEHKSHSSKNKYSSNRTRHSSRSPNAKESHNKDKREQSSYDHHSYTDINRYRSAKDKNYDYKENSSSHSRDKGRDYNKSRYSPEVSTKKYRDEERSKKSSDSFRKTQYEQSKHRNRYDSESPDVSLRKDRDNRKSKNSSDTFKQTHYEQQSRNRGRHSSASPEVSPKKYRDAKKGRISSNSFKETEYEQSKNRSRYSSDSSEISSKKYGDVEKSRKSDALQKTKFEQSKGRNRYSSDSPEISSKKYRYEEKSRNSSDSFKKIPHNLSKKRNTHDSDSSDTGKRKFYGEQRQQSPPYERNVKTKYEENSECDDDRRYKKHKSSYKQDEKADILSSKSRKCESKKSSHKKKHKKHKTSKRQSKSSSSSD